MILLRVSFGINFKVAENNWRRVVDSVKIFFKHFPSYKCIDPLIPAKKGKISKAKAPFENIRWENGSIFEVYANAVADLKQTNKKMPILLGEGGGH